MGGGFSLEYLLFGSGLIFLGYLFRRAKSKPEPTRFSSIRKVQNHVRGRREEKQVQKEEVDDKTDASF